MMVVLAIMVVLAAITVPSLNDMYQDYVLASAADGVQAAWAEARGRAINEGRSYRFAVVPGYANFRIAPDGPAFWSGAGEAGPDSDEPALVLQDILPRGIRFVGADGPALDPGFLSGETALPADGVSPDMWVPVVVFLPDGTATHDAEVFLQSKNTDLLRLRLRGLTTGVTADRLSADGSPR
jgi:hypothetical protein